MVICKKLGFRVYINKRIIRKKSFFINNQKGFLTKKTILLPMRDLLYKKLLQSKNKCILVNSHNSYKLYNLLLVKKQKIKFKFELETITFLLQKFSPKPKPNISPVQEVEVAMQQMYPQIIITNP